MPFLAPSPLLEPDFTRYPHYSSKSRNSLQIAQHIMLNCPGLGFKNTVSYHFEFEAIALPVCLQIGGG
jgi:hypothetical protein